ncbi:MAG TPA: putative toxin-antitoxin system toxin component, PIN family [Synergistaceae bacterium]|nr:putative toxin-antitoxin system toxin component, PIN family [Synergistaceae bacterium]
MLDTNVLLSAILFPGQGIERCLRLLVEKHHILLSSLVVAEMEEVVHRKFPGKEGVLQNFLEGFSFEMVFSSKHPEPGLFEIRDPADYPILYAALLEDVDVFITGDKDFMDVALERPEILSPRGFLEKYDMRR